MLKEDIELIDIILKKAYNVKEGQPYMISQDLFKENEDKKINVFDLERIWKKMLGLRLLALRQGYESWYMITHEGMELMKEYGNYAAYLQHQEKEKKKENRKKIFDRLLDKTNIIIGIIIAVFGFVLGQFPKGNTQDQQLKEQQVKELSAQNDSLKQVVKTLQNTIDSVRSKRNLK